MTRLLALLGEIGADPTDDDDTRRRKALLVYLAVLILPISLVWGTLYLSLGAVSGLVAFGYFTVSVASLTHWPMRTTGCNRSASKGSRSTIWSSHHLIGTAGVARLTGKPSHNDTRGDPFCGILSATCRCFSTATTW